jgi:uncharacterized protein YidB (DUF937 family)
VEDIMGILDILNGMQNGPKGQSDPNAKGGMSPMTMAILALLAYKAYQKVGGAQVAPAPGGTIPNATPSGGGLGDLLNGGLGDLLGGRAGVPRSAPGQVSNAGHTGGLDDLLKGGLGGLLAGGAAGGLLGNGLNDLLKGFQHNGFGDVADSWVGTGANKEIAPNDLAKSIGLDDIDHVARQSGMSRDDLLSGLSQQLPGLVDELTPNGRLPTTDELSRLFGR